MGNCIDECLFGPFYRERELMEQRKYNAAQIAQLGASRRRTQRQLEAAIELYNPPPEELAPLIERLKTYEFTQKERSKNGALLECQVRGCIQVDLTTQFMVGTENALGVVKDGQSITTEAADIAIKYKRVNDQSSNMNKSLADLKEGMLDDDDETEERHVESYKERVDQIKEIIETVGPKKIAKELGVERYLASLSADERRRLKELLK